MTLNEIKKVALDAWALILDQDYSEKD